MSHHFFGFQQLFLHLVHLFFHLFSLILILHEDMRIKPFCGLCLLITLFDRHMRVLRVLPGRCGLILDASLLWVQQKESESAFNVAAIPSELNCADIGAKNLTRKRLFGLLYMLKMIDVVGGRVGHEEYTDLEYQYQTRRGAKKMMNSKDIRKGLLLLPNRRSRERRH